MADWTTPPWSQLVAGKPWTDEKAAAAFENPIAMFDAAPGAPKLRQRSFYAGGGATAVFTGLDVYGGLQFLVSAKEFPGPSYRTLLFNYSTNGGASWSGGLQIGSSFGDGEARIYAGAFDFETGALRWVCLGLNFVAEGGATTFAGASLSINAIKFECDLVHAVITPNGGAA